MKAYQLKIVIKDSKPPIWSRILVPEKITFLQLHEIIQAVFCWDNNHLYEFEFPEVGIRVVDDVEEAYAQDEMAIISEESFIDELMIHSKKFKYTYDFGDDWQHEITIEKVVSPYPFRYPQVIKYKGDVLPEDCGGIYGYYDLLETIENPKSEEDEELREWAIMQGWADYDIDEVNSQMKEHLEFPLARKIKKINKNQGVLQEIHPSTSLDEKETLSEIYSSYRKQDIVSIAKSHHISSYSQYNKGDLIDYVMAYILKPENMINCFLCMDDLEIEAFEGVLEAGKHVLVHEPLLFEYLLLNGYIGQAVDGAISIPIEVASAYSQINTAEFRNKRKRLRLIGDYCSATNYLYSVTPIEFVVTLFNWLEQDKVTQEEIDDIYEILSLYRCDFVKIKDKFVEKSFLEGDLYIDLIKEQGNKPYYIPNKEEVKWFGRYGSEMYSEEVMGVYIFLTSQLDLAEMAASTICHEIQQDMAMGIRLPIILNNIKKIGIKFKTAKQEEAFTELLLGLWNNTRMIINRGHTPNEVKEMEKKRQPGSNIIPFPSKE